MSDESKHDEEQDEVAFDLPDRRIRDGDGINSPIDFEISHAVLREPAGGRLGGLKHPRGHRFEQDFVSPVKQDRQEDEDEF